MKKYLVLLSCLGMAMTACNSKLDIAPPNLVTDERFGDLLDERRDQVTSGLVGGLTNAMVSNMDGAEIRYQNWSTYNYTQSLRGNDLVFATEGQGWNRDEYRFINIRAALSDKNLQFWRGLYLKIGPANQALMFLEDVEPQLNVSAGAPSEAFQKTLMKNKAIALTVRAFYYQYLIWIYQNDYLHGGADKDGVPLQLNYYEDPSAETPKARAKTSLVYDQIIKDLTDAIKLFDTAGITATAAKNDLEQGVARALLLRAYVSTGRYGDAVREADLILAAFPSTLLMNELQYTATDTSVDIDKKNTPATCANATGFLIQASNSEALLMFPYTSTGSGSSFAGWTNIFGDNAAQGGSVGGYAAIDPRLYDQISDEDYRKKNFLANDYNNGQEYYYEVQKVGRKLLKYYNTKFGSIGRHPSVTANNTQFDECFIRLSEVILLKAEAELRGGTGDWKATLNQLIEKRTRTGLTVDTYSTDAWYTGLTDLQKLQLQWRIEYWGEQGWEWYNNKRWDLPVDRIAAGPTGTVSGHIDDRARVQYSQGVEFTWQIPQVEINYNPLCTQNP